MSRVYLDAAALTVGGAGSVRRMVAPGAVEALDRLLEEGHDVFLLGRVPSLERTFGPRLRRIEEVPSGIRDAWLITGDPERCDRPLSGCRVVLVGGAIGSRTLPTRHCDDEVRDLAQAVLTVLMAVEMPAEGRAPVA